MTFFERSTTINAEMETESDEESTSENVDVFGQLPVEIVEKILFFLRPEDLTSALSALNLTAEISNDYFWKRLCQREEYFEKKESKRSEFYTGFFERYNYWQAVYWYHYTLQRNWETNNYKEITYEVEEPYSIDFLYIFNDGFAPISMDSDNTLYVYGLNDEGPTVCFLPSHVNIFGGFMLKNEKYLVHFNRTQSLTVWDLEDGSTVLDELWRAVTNIAVDKNLIVLETRNEKLEVYNIETGQFEYEFYGTISKIYIMDGRIIFTTMDHVVHILKWNDKSLITLACCNETINHDLLLKNDILLSLCTKQATGQVTLCVWNIATKTKLRSTSLRCSLINLQCEFFMNNYLYLRKYEDIDDDELSFSVELWDYMKGTHEVAVSCGIKRVLDLNIKLFNNNFMIATQNPSSELGIWCLRTREFICNLDFTLNSDLYDENILITETKLAYVVSHHGTSISLYLRDYEV